MEDLQTQKTDTKVTYIKDESLYVPSSVEKKRSVIMYFLFGIIITIVNSKKLNPFELFHLKQSIGRRLLFIIILILSLMFIFVPLLKYLIIFVFLFMIVILIIFIKKAWDGKYVLSKENKLYIFEGVGGRLLDLFDINISLDGSKE
ncbi:MAG: hypothetical protein WC872_01820 [Candidatus Absconditabacterales bacterium]